ncbi:MAG: hemolysin family protein [Dehalococcoidia bacterium]|jgi:putative hemolysin
MVYFEIIIIIFLTMLNGLLAMSELAIVSSRKSRLEQMMKNGDKGARSALRLLENPSRFLSTVQIGITLIGLIAGAFSGATIGHRLGLWLDSFPVISPYGDILGIGVTVIAITYLSVIIGELVPKRIAFAQPERIAASIARPMQVLSLIFTPAVWLLHVSTEGVLRVFHMSANRETSITEDEVKSLITEGTRAGVFAPQEKEMIDGVLRLADRPVRAIMTPHSKIIWLDLQSDRDTILKILETNRFSRVLVCDGTLDKPIGVVNAKDLLPKAMTCADINLADLITPLLYVPENTSILILLNQFKKEKVHVAAVIDEYGMTKGLVTLTDVIEAVAGDLPELGEDMTPEITQRDDGSWLIDGMLPTDELESITGISVGKSMKILAGFVMEQLGHIPAAGESFIYGSYRFEVVDMDGNRIDKVLIQNIQNAAEAQSSD